MCTCDVRYGGAHRHTQGPAVHNTTNNEVVAVGISFSMRSEEFWASARTAVIAGRLYAEGTHNTHATSAHRTSHIKKRMKDGEEEEKN